MRPICAHIAVTFMAWCRECFAWASRLGLCMTVQAQLPQLGATCAHPSHGCANALGPLVTLCFMKQGSGTIAATGACLAHRHQRLGLSNQSTPPRQFNALRVLYAVCAALQVANRVLQLKLLMPAADVARLLYQVHD